MKIKKRYLIGIIGTTMFVGFVTYATVQTIPEENLALASEQEVTEDTPLIIDDNANNNLQVKLSGLNTFYPKKVQTPIYQTPLTTEALTVEEVPIVATEPEIVEPEPTIPDVYYDDEEYPSNEDNAITKNSLNSKNKYNEIENEGYDD